MAFHAIKAGEGDAYISAGVETVSRFGKGTSDFIPGVDDIKNPAFAPAETRTAMRAEGGADLWRDPRAGDELPDVYIAMGQTAENVQQLIGMSREEQDEFGVRSQNLAEKAINDGFWAREITPVTLPDGSTASTDDAAAIVVMSDTKAKELGLTPLARSASRSASPGSRQRSWVNVNGGAIAVGHPFGMTGARIAATLINSLQWHDKQFGDESMCVGGGMGMAMMLERLSWTSWMAGSVGLRPHQASRNDPPATGQAGSLVVSLQAAAQGEEAND